MHIFIYMKFKQKSDYTILTITPCKSISSTVCYPISDILYPVFSSVQFSRSVVSGSLHPMDCSKPGLRVHDQLPEFTLTHVHWVSHAIQPSHFLSSPSPPAFSLSQHQGLFQRAYRQIANALWYFLYIMRHLGFR